MMIYRRESRVARVGEVDKSQQRLSRLSLIPTSLHCQTRTYLSLELEHEQCFSPNQETQSSMTSNSHLIPLSLLVPILPPLLLPTLLRAHAPNIISNVSPSNPLTRLIDFDLNLPGLLPAIAFSLLAVVLTSKGIQSTKDVFKERGFKGRDMLKPASKDEM